MAISLFTPETQLSWPQVPDAASDVPKYYDASEDPPLLLNGMSAPACP